MLHRCWPLPLILLALLLVCCQPPVERELAKSTWRIMNGQPDTAHPAVAALWFGGGYMCSGSLISPDVILTAGHCCSGFSTSGYTACFGASTSGPGNCQVASRTVASINLHPNYSVAGDGAPSNDICLLKLSSSAPSSISPVPYLPSSLGLTSADVGQTVEFVGFGLDNSGNTGTRQTVTNAIDVVCENPSRCTFDGSGQAVQHSIGYDENPGGPCEGDSGGPAFITRGGTQYVAGATSYGDQNCQYYGVSTTVSDFETFINGIVGGVNGATCSTGSQCNSKNCVNSVCCVTSSCSPCNTCANNTSQPGNCHPASDGFACPDGNKCNGDETCQGGVCTAGTPPNCTSSNPCKVGSCDPTNGCVQTPVANGTSCSDNNLCNGLETCQNGVCQAGTPPDCNDNNFCTTDVCDSQNGCLHLKVKDDTDCGGGVCGQATCSDGQCQYANPEICDDKDPCTTDNCDPVTGCIHTWLPDGDQCGDCMMCQAHACVAVPDCSTSSCGCAAQGGQGGSEGAGVALLLLVVVGWFGRRKAV